MRTKRVANMWVKESTMGIEDCGEVRRSKGLCMA